MTNAAATDNDRRGRQRPAWEEHLNAAAAKYPVANGPIDDYADILADYDLLGRLYRDALRVGYEPPSRRGQRSPLEWNDGTARMRALALERQGEATTKPFPAALADLADARNRNASQLATMFGLTRWRVRGFLDGTVIPKHDDLEIVAAAFDKAPTYFIEYRAHLVLSRLADNLAASPERGIDVLVRMGVLPDVADL